ncbi:MAG: lipid-A-disaccharide synthase [Pyrinomonadaceae bacterium]
MEGKRDAEFAPGCYIKFVTENMELESLSLMIVAGENSGDKHAAALVRALRARMPATQTQFFGSTGEEMRRAGVETIIRHDDLAITGLIEVGRALPVFWRVFNRLKRAAVERKPDAVVLVDWPEFNLRLARALHRRGLKVIYYISPQLWAWRAYRVRQIARDVDLLLAILPFEPQWYKQRGVEHVEFVGHPLASGTVKPRIGKEEFCRSNNLNPAQPVIALLPGSRRMELKRNLPTMLDAAVEILKARSEAQFVTPLAANRPPAEVETLLAKYDYHQSSTSLRARLRVVQNLTYEAVAAADAAAVASGTATLEAAIIGTPLVVVYKESWLNWNTLGRLINTEHFGLVNLIAEERIATELMQNDFTPRRLATELLHLLDKERNEATRARLRRATARLGTGNASDEAADRVLRAVREWRKKE